LVILALAYDALGQRTSARECLAEALSLAEPMDLVRTFVDRGLPIAGLLRSLADRKRRAPYLNKLLAALEPATARRPFVTSVLPARPRSSLIEPLRPREVEILGHVADGRSNKEIADEMIMAVSTVKWYLRNIYGKLDVNRRTQALARARELNLL
jgi:LuxR family maltose regulon positive regulatory protein